MKNNTARDKIVGIHAVRILLKVRPFDIYEIYLSDKKSKKFSQIINEAKKNNITIQNISNEKIYNFTNVKSHQGVLAVAKKKEDISEKDLVNFLNNKPKNQIVLILDEVSDPRNFGACLRICDAYKISAVIIKDHDSVNVNETVRKVAAGGAETIPIIKVKNISRTLDTLKKNNYWIYGATDKAQNDVNDISFKTPIALIIGGESSGLRKKTLENCDFTLKIDMGGVVESLNMAVATGIIINTIHTKIK
jgi:23S rRNA (guanosine2251-2'-O)-methyltransferase|tara:strand:+ start:32 stop:778 length:747 start_codon:yes stop_codon:yes gene_type:complete